MKTQVEVGVEHPHDQEPPEPPKVERGRKDPPSAVWSRHSPAMLASALREDVPLLSWPRLWKGGCQEQSQVSQLCVQVDILGSDDDVKRCHGAPNPGVLLGECAACGCMR